MLFYQPISPSEAEDYKKLKDRLEEIGKKQHNIESNYIFYLSTPPSLYDEIPKQLSEWV